MATTNNNSTLGALDRTLETYFLDKAPKLPADIQKVIVEFGPWVLLVGVIISIPALISVFGISTALAPYGAMMGSSAYSSMSIYWILGIIVLILEALALPGLFKKQMQSWKLLWYATLVGVVEALITFNIVGLIIGSGLGFYILYQIRHHYK